MYEHILWTAFLCRQRQNVLKGTLSSKLFFCQAVQPCPSVQSLEAWSRARLPPLREDCRDGKWSIPPGSSSPTQALPTPQLKGRGTPSPIQQPNLAPGQREHFFFPSQHLTDHGPAHGQWKLRLLTFQASLEKHVFPKQGMLGGVKLFVFL